MIALVPVRDGVLPAGADEAIAECAGRAILVGSGLADLDLDGLALTAHLVELGAIEPGRWCAVLPALIDSIIDDDESIVLPNSPDGRDLAPRLAAAMHRPLHAGATTVSPSLVRVARRGGLELHEHHPAEAFVATLQPGVRGAERFTEAVEVTEHALRDAAEQEHRRRVRGRRRPCRRGHAARCAHHGPERSAPDRRRRRRPRQRGTIRPAGLCSPRASMG